MVWWAWGWGGVGWVSGGLCKLCDIDCEVWMGGWWVGGGSRVGGRVMIVQCSWRVGRAGGEEGKEEGEGCLVVESFYAWEERGMGVASGLGLEALGRLGRGEGLGFSFRKGAAIHLG